MTQRHWMTLEGDDYLDQLFVWHVDDLLACCLQNEELHPFTRLRMAHTLRILTLNGKGNHLAFRVQKRRQSELIVLIAEAHGDEEPEIIPSEILRYFEPITEESHPPGVSYHPYKLGKYLDLRGQMILDKRDITPRAAITFLARKMGGSHVDDDRSSEIEFLLNKRFRIFGDGAIYTFFDGCAYNICQSLMPLRNEVAVALG